MSSKEPRRKVFWVIRLWFQWALSACGLNNFLSLVQYCDRCGMSGAKWPSWWAGAPLWEKVAGNVNGHHHGCYCPRCFTDIAISKGVCLTWIPQEEPR